jgi:REP element-mobilizing transposase RayT
LVEHDIRMFCEWKGCDVEELNVQPDHIHLWCPFHREFLFQN